MALLKSILETKYMGAMFILWITFQLVELNKNQAGEFFSNAYRRSSPRPHIVMIVADDLGWTDVGWKDPLMHTPTLDGLAKEGVVLNQHYVQPVCSPSRAAFMSGYYPYHLGLQHKVRNQA